MSALKDQITDDMKNAMRAKDTARLGTIRLLLAACKQKEVDERVALDDAMVVAIVDKLIKQRKGQRGRVRTGQPARVGGSIEAAEIAVLSAYLSGAHERRGGDGRGEGHRGRSRRQGAWRYGESDVRSQNPTRRQGRYGPGKRSGEIGAVELTCLARLP